MDPHRPLLAQGDPVLCLPTLPILVYMLGFKDAFKGFLSPSLLGCLAEE